MKFLRKIHILLFLFALPLIAGAQTQGGGGNSGTPGGGGNRLVGFDNPLEPNSTICQALKLFLNALSAVGGPVAVLFLVYAGFRLVWARGNEKELEHAKRNLYYTIIGIGIFIGAWVLGQIIANTLAQLGVSANNPNSQIGQCR